MSTPPAPERIAELESALARAEQRIGALVQSCQARESERDQAREATQTQAQFYEQRIAALEQGRDEWEKKGNYILDSLGMK